MTTKLVTAPILNSDMDDDLESKTIYIFDYDKSQKFDKTTNFLDYINDLGLLSDIYFCNTSKEERFELLLYYMNNKIFNHITSFNIAILNCIYKLKNANLRLKGSALTNEMEIEFSKLNKSLLNRWMDFFDSYLVYMIVVASNKDKSIKERYGDKICNDKDLSPNMVSLFLDDFFYDYYKTGINDNNIKYWKYYYDNKLYDNKSFNTIMLNDANFIIKILHDTSTNNKWNEFLEKHL